MSTNEDAALQLINLLDRRDQDLNLSLINQLSEISQKIQGFTEPVISRLLDVILDTTTSNALKTNDKLDILDNCLVVQADLSSGVFLKILSSVGVPQAYYKRGERYKTRTLSSNLQLRLLDWVVSNFPHFAKSAVQSGSVVLSLLIKSLSYEFSRGYISQLIMLLLKQKKSTIKTYLNREIYHHVNILMSWHIKWVADLYSKFPLDVYLRELLAFFKTVKPDLDYIVYSPDNFQILNKLIPVDKVVLGDVPRVKRARALRNGSEGIDELISTIDNINKLNPYVLLRSCLQDKDKCKLIALAFQRGNAKFINKIDGYVKINLEDKLMNQQEYDQFFALLVNILENSGGTIQLSSVKHFVSYPQKPYFKSLGYRSKLIKYTTKLQAWELVDIIERDISYLKQKGNEDDSIVKEYLTGILDLFKLKQEQSIHETLNQCIPKLFELILLTNCKDSLTYKLIQYLQSLPSSVINQLTETAVLPPPTSVYSMLLDGDIVYLSSICNHIANSRKFKYKNPELKQLQNSYIMDTVNFLWRDKFMHSEAKSANRGMYLPATLVDKLSSHYDISQPATLGNIFMNPALSYIVTRIVWKLEDEQEVGIRHAGPISRQSVIELNESDWLNMSYDDLKVKIIEKLDGIASDGVCELLYTSLKPLADKRGRV